MILRCNKYQPPNPMAKSPKIPPLTKLIQNEAGLASGVGTEDVGIAVSAAAVCAFCGVANESAVV